MPTTPRNTGERPSPADIASELFDRLPNKSRFSRWTGTNWITVSTKLTAEYLATHVDGREVLGVYPTADDVARLGVIDIDLHVKGLAPTAEEIADNEAFALKKRAELESLGVACLLVRGHQSGSYHIWFWTAMILAAQLGRWLKSFVADAGKLTVDTFPARTGKGNAVRLPGRHHKHPDEWSAAWTGSGWAAWPAAFHALVTLKDNSADLFLDPGVPSTRHWPSTPDRGNRPGDVFNLSVSVEEVLLKHGWTVERMEGDRVYYCRPGKSGGISASVKNGMVWVFTSSVAGLASSDDTDKAYTAFALVTHLEYGGDFSRAARELAHAGYGEKTAHAIESVGRVGNVVGASIPPQPPSRPASQPASVPSPRPTPQPLPAAKPPLPPSKTPAAPILTRFAWMKRYRVFLTLAGIAALIVVSTALIVVSTVIIPRVIRQSGGKQNDAGLISKGKDWTFRQLCEHLNSRGVRCEMKPASTSSVTSQ